MRIDFHAMEAREVPGMNGGTGTLAAKMFVGEKGKIIPCAIHPGGSIGLHRHKTSDDINFILSGEGVAVCDGVEEALSPGVCHICPMGAAHSIVNTGTEDLCMLTVVVERPQA